MRKHREDLAQHSAVLLVHGFAQNRYSWHLSSRSLVNYLADAGIDVYNLELTGHGRSREFGTAPANSFDEYVNDKETSGKWRLECVKAPTLGLSRPLEIFRAARSNSLRKYKAHIPISGGP